MWLIFLFGLILITSSCEGRAVNISNTWTMPQERFNLFYRFFRDQISWFEADAVCQFHHANLVTVDNSFAFDASKNFLKELDVTETVWIGLMRSQSSDKFAWSNSKYLMTSSENWADPLPLIDSPLCAVIDPVRDYRWHALRCGGPETASFLCEMNVPSWAEECILQNVPSLTIQYMADSGTVEITKDCGSDEGSISHVCKGKQDRDEIIKNLRCKNEQQSILTTQSSNLINTHQETLDIIKKISSDNNEDNSIDTQAITVTKSTEKSKAVVNPVQRIIDQFKAEELMQGDEPQKAVNNQDPKTLENKKLNKKVKLNFEKKLKSRKQKKYNENINRGRNIDDMMMGDQPMLGDDDVMDLNQIQEPLPHQKKMMPPIIKHEEDEKLDKDKIEKGSTAQENILISSTTPEVTSSMSNVVTVSSQDAQIEQQKKSENLKSDEEIKITTSTDLESSTEKNIEVTIVEATTIPSEVVTLNAVEPKTATIGHPMHPQQPRSNVISEETGHHKETNDNHFIPPMLMVKSHYITPKLNLYHDAENFEVSETNNESASTIIYNTNNRNAINNLDLTTINEISDITEANTIQKLTSPSGSDIQKEDLPDIPTNLNKLMKTSTIISETETATSNTKDSEPAHNISTLTSGQGHGTIPIAASNVAELLPSSSQSNKEIKQNLVAKIGEITIDSTNSPTTIQVITKTNVEQESTQELTTASSHLISSTLIPTVQSTTSSQKLYHTMLPETTTNPALTLISNEGLATFLPDHIEDTVNFEDDNSQSYFKPNRRRSLTHSEQGSYLKKILG